MCSKAGREGQRESVLPHQAAISLSTPAMEFLLPSFSSESGNWSTHFLSQSPQASRISHLGAVQRLEPGLCSLQEAQEEPCRASCPGAAALGLGQPLLGLPLICSTLSFLLQLLFSSDLPGTGPYLTWEKQCHVHHEDFSDPPLPYICSWLCHWGLCHVGHLPCLTIPQFPLLLHSQLGFRDKRS